MILPLFGIFLLLSLSLIITGLIIRDHSELSIIGFLFLFLLSLIIINGNLEYETGVIINTTYNYDADGDVTDTDQVINYSYDNYIGDNYRTIGYWLAVISAAGMIGVFVSLRGGVEKSQQLNLYSS